MSTTHRHGTNPTLSETNIRYILGLKLRQFRRARQMSLKQLSKASGLSVSYLNEIEKGKKFPKPNKSIELARVLGVSYDDLHSLQLRGNLAPLSRFLTHPFFQRFPIEQFGISPSNLLDSMSTHPTRFATLVHTLVRIARRYDLDHEELSRAALRSHIELHRNYFANLERASDQYRKEMGWPAGRTPPWDELAAHLEKKHGCKVNLSAMASEPALESVPELFKPGKKPVLFLNPALDPARRAFYLSREIAFQITGLRRKDTIEAPIPGSFSPPLEDYHASYLAGCLLIDRKPFLRQIEQALAAKTFDPAIFTGWMAQYQVTPSVLMNRLCQLLPRFSGLENLFLVRIDRGTGPFNYQIGREIHLSQTHAAQAWGSDEHYCRRWTPIRLLKELASDRSLAPHIRISRLTFVDTEQEYLTTSIAYRNPLRGGMLSSVVLGLVMDQRLKRYTRMWDHKDIECVQVGETCERCALKNCDERAAPPTVLDAAEIRKNTEDASLRLLTG
ncbi:MAG: helix-turn-helix domain-containing protein [Verrucomicrobiota bacterium JB023]|nr:helix-turn-helix domain-containing protein [Verrucomicrobiota bacterium JB023]